MDLDRPRTPEALAAAARAYIENGIEAELRKAMSVQGGRNNALNNAAFAIGRMVAARWIDEDAAAQRLMEVAVATGLAQSDGERAAERTIQSGLRKGIAGVPRELPAHLASADLSGLVVKPISAEAVARAKLLAVEEAERSASERMSAWLRVRDSGYLARCHAALHEHADALAELRRRGISENTLAAFGLGWDAFPLPDAPERYGPKGRRPSIVMPWPSLDNPGAMDAIQYRHTDAAGPKIHWHHDLHPGYLFNPTAVTRPHDDVLFVVEGALAACTLHSAGITSVAALPQLQIDRSKVAAMAERMTSFERVYWMPDRGGAAVWRDYAALVPGGKGVMVTLPLDPDDYMIARGGDADAFWRAVNHTR